MGKMVKAPQDIREIFDYTKLQSINAFGWNTKSPSSFDEPEL